MVAADADGRRDTGWLRDISVTVNVAAIVLASQRVSSK